MSDVGVPWWFHTEWFHTEWLILTNTRFYSRQCITECPRVKHELRKASTVFELLRLVGPPLVFALCSSIQVPLCLAFRWSYGRFPHVLEFLELGYKRQTLPEARKCVACTPGLSARCTRSSSQFLKRLCRSRCKFETTMGWSPVGTRSKELPKDLERLNKVQYCTVLHLHLLLYMASGFYMVWGCK